MTAFDRLESELTAWFVDTAIPMTDDDMHLILQRTAGMRQRPRWTFLERWLPMQADTLAVPSRSPSMRNLAILAALLILAAAIAVVAGGARPTPFSFDSPAANGLVAFAEGGDIVIVDPATGMVGPLIDSPAQEHEPVFSWDGTKVAFVRQVGVDDVLLVVPVDGDADDAVPLTDGPMDVLNPSWSFDDRTILSSNGDIALSAADGSGTVIRTFDIRAQQARFRPPDGQQIQFTNAGDNTSLYLMDVDGDPFPITGVDGGIVRDRPIGWTPDGDRLVTMRPRPSDAGSPRLEAHVLTVGRDGIVTEDVVVGPPAVIGPYGAALSPDGTRVVVPAATEATGSTWQATVVSLDPSVASIPAGSTFAGDAFQLGWTPDGRTIVINDETARRTWLIGADGTSGPANMAPWHDASGSLLQWQRVAP